MQNKSIITSETENNASTKKDNITIYTQNKHYFDFNYVPQQSEIHGTMPTIENRISDFISHKRTGKLAPKYRVDQHEYGITHEWYHWVKPIQNLLSSVLVDNIKTICISAIVFYCLGMFFLNNGLVSVFAYLLFFLLNNIAFLTVNSQNIFSYNLSKLLYFLTHKYPCYNSVINGEQIHISKINNNIMKAHLWQKVIPFFILTVFTGYFTSFFINFICSINFTYTFGNFIWLFAILFPFANFHQFSILFWKSFFKNFFAKKIYKI